MKVLIVGSNPSSKNINPNIPFEGTKSLKALQTWISFLEINNYQIVNIFDEVTDNNRPLTKREIKRCLLSFRKKLDNLEYDKIIALGSSASVALTLLKLDHYKMFHPSPRNRQLNSKELVDNKLKECKIYLYENN